MPTGDIAERVIWALQSPASAKVFAKKKIFPNTADGEKIVRWLDAFKKNELFKADDAASV